MYSRTKKKGFIMVLAPIMLMIFLWKPIDFIKSISSSKSFSSVSIAVAKNKKLEIQKQSPRGVLRNFTKFSRKLLCQSLFFNNVTGKRPATLLKKKLWHRCFPVNFVKFLRTPLFTEISGGWFYKYAILLPTFHSYLNHELKLNVELQTIIKVSRKC